MEEYDKLKICESTFVFKDYGRCEDCGAYEDCEDCEDCGRCGAYEDCTDCEDCFKSNLIKILKENKHLIHNGDVLISDGYEHRFINDDIIDLVKGVIYSFQIIEFESKKYLVDFSYPLNIPYPVKSHKFYVLDNPCFWYYIIDVKEMIRLLNEAFSHKATHIYLFGEKLDITCSNIETEYEQEMSKHIKYLEKYREVGEVEVVGEIVEVGDNGEIVEVGEVEDNGDVEDVGEIVEVGDNVEVEDNRDVGDVGDYYVSYTPFRSDLNIDISETPHLHRVIGAHTYETINGIGKARRYTIDSTIIG